MPGALVTGGLLRVVTMPLVLVLRRSSNSSGCVLCV